MSLAGTHSAGWVSSSWTGCRWASGGRPPPQATAGNKERAGYSKAETTLPTLTLRAVASRTGHRHRRTSGSGLPSRISLIVAGAGSPTDADVADALTPCGIIAPRDDECHDRDPFSRGARGGAGSGLAGMPQADPAGPGSSRGPAGRPPGRAGGAVPPATGPGRPTMSLSWRAKAPCARSARHSHSPARWSEPLLGSGTAIVVDLGLGEQLIELSYEF